MQAETESKTTSELGDRSRQFELLVNSVTDYAIYMLDTQGNIRSWNSGAEQIKGYSATEVLGTNYSRFYPVEDVARDIPSKNLDKAATEGRFVEEGWRLRRDGTRFRAFVVIDPIWQAGELIGFAKVTRDVTERYEHEERLKEARNALLQSQKLEAVGKLTLGLAHDFNNLLAIVINSLDLIGAKVTDDKVKVMVETALRASERGAVLTRQLLVFGRGQPLAPERTDVNVLLCESEALLRRSAGDSVSLTLDLGEGLAEVDLDVAQFEAAVLNLVCNSRDAMPSGGTISITTYMQQMRNPSAPGKLEQNFVVVEVKDTGEGIPHEHQTRVFEPFFTTKEIGRGSGLGLSQVFGFSSQSGGFAQIESTPGHGTTVFMRIPARIESAE